MPSRTALCLRAGANDVWASPTIARLGATSSLDCLTEFAQLLDRSWFLPDNGVSTNVTSDVATWADCVALCPSQSTCQYVTYNYRLRTCTVRLGSAVVLEG